MFRRHDDHPLPPHVGRRVHSPIDCGLNPASVASLLDISVRHSQHYAAGEWPVPLATTGLLRRWSIKRIWPDDIRLANRPTFPGTTRGHHLALNGMSGWGNSSD
jgi:hypothetical protein